jgi:hypothetical protein
VLFGNGVDPIFALIANVESENGIRRPAAGGPLSIGFRMAVPDFLALLSHIFHFAEYLFYEIKDLIKYHAVCAGCGGLDD